MTRFSVKFSALAAASFLALTGCASDGSQTSAKSTAVAKPGSEIVAMRRLTEAQYRNAMADIFAPDLRISGRFEPEVRREGLQAIGSSAATISSSGMEQYYAIATAVADQVMDAKHRAKTVTCKPASEQAADDVCAAEVVNKYGRLLFRRPLTAAEAAERVQLARAVATDSKDFYAGVHEALISLLSAPEHLFRIETARPDRSRPGGKRLDGYSRAQRISYMFWNTTPDEELLRAAESGALDTPEGLKAQVDRLAASPRAADGVSAFFDDMLHMSLFDTQIFDPNLFPKYGTPIARAAREQTLKTIVQVLITENGDYRELFTTRKTFMNRNLAMVYKTPFNTTKEWTPHTFSEDTGRAGILTQVSFLSLFSHPGRSSPTKRGVALNEIFFCQTTPMPPNDVDFTVVNDTHSVTLKTVRARLLAHATDETCAGCHNLVDPLGLSLERFDALGQRRDMENGELIDVTADYDGVKFEGAGGLAKLMHDDPRVPECLVRNLYSSARGKPTEVGEPVITALTKDFIAGGYRLPAFLKKMASDEAFYDLVPPTMTKVAALTTQSPVGR